VNVVEGTSQQTDYRRQQAISVQHQNEHGSYAGNGDSHLRCDLEPVHGHDIRKEVYMVWRWRQTIYMSLRIGSSDIMAKSGRVKESDRFNELWDQDLKDIDNRRMDRAFMEMTEHNTCMAQVVRFYFNTHKEDDVRAFVKANRKKYGIKKVKWSSVWSKYRFYDGRTSVREVGRYLHHRVAYCTLSDGRMVKIIIQVGEAPTAKTIDEATTRNVSRTVFGV